MRSRVLPTLALLASVFSYEAASAQQVSQVTYPTSSSIVCTPQQQRSLVQNTQALEKVAQAAFSGCVTSSAVSDCKAGGSLDAIKKGLTGNLLTMLTSAEYDPIHSTITLKLETPQGRQGFVQYQDIDNVSMQSIIATAKPFCY